MPIYSEETHALNNIQYLTEDISFDFINKKRISQWIFEVVQKEKKQIKNVTYIYCSDEYLHSINLSYLNHRYE